MTSKDILYNKGKNNECYTLDYGVKPILKYIPKDAVVWCPFDLPDSEFVKQISKTNKVIATHIREGQDFLHTNQKSIGIVSYRIHLLQTRGKYLNEHFHLESHLL